MKTVICFAVFLLASMLSACAGLEPIGSDVPRNKTFDYVVDGRSQVQLWRSARDHFAEIYGDSRSVIRVADESDGTILGRGLAAWDLAGGQCHSAYNIRFAAKDGKARLQLELVDGVQIGSNCRGWPAPSADGYKQIMAEFSAISSGLEKALKEGQNASLKDF